MYQQSLRNKAFANDALSLRGLSVTQIYILQVKFRRLTNSPKQGSQVMMLIYVSMHLPVSIHQAAVPHACMQARKQCPGQSVRARKL